jgi:hypothetical protein
VDLQIREEAMNNQASVKGAIRKFWATGFVLAGVCLAAMLTGCSPASTSVPVASVPPTVPPATLPPPSSPPETGSTPLVGPNLYVEDDGRSDYEQIFVFPASTNGSVAPTLSIGDLKHSSTNVSVDGSGNIYVLSTDFTNNYAEQILEYAPTVPLGAPLRSLPVGAGTNIPSVTGLYTSASGELFVVDGTGLSVFGATANGSDSPERHITGDYLAADRPNTAYYAITVDANDNVYVANNSSTPLVVYGPTATGSAAPDRAIGGPLTQMDSYDGQYPPYIGGITTDKAGNLYVVCLCVSGFGVYEFAPNANGNVAPIRTITSQAMYPYFFSLGIAVDSVGDVLVSAGMASTGLPAVFTFAPDAMGEVNPISTATVAGWVDSENPQIALH